MILTYTENEKVLDMKNFDSDSEIFELLQSIYEIVDTNDPSKSIKTIASFGVCLKTFLSTEGFEIKLVQLKSLLFPLNSWM